MQIKDVKNYVGLSAALITVGTIGGALYVLERDGDASAREDVKLNRKVDDLELKFDALKEQFHKQDKSCAVLKATISSGRYSYSYCKDSKYDSFYCEK